MSVTAPRPSQRGHMPPVMLKLRRSFTVLPPRSNATAPDPLMEATLKENAWAEPMCGFPSRLNKMRSSALASVAVPTVERGSVPIRCWSTMIAVVSPSRTSTSGRASAGMKPWTKALYVSLISRCDSAAIVSNTSELLPEPDTPVNTVSRRFGISTLTSLRLFTRAPCTRIIPWLSAAPSAGDCVAVLAVAVLAAILIVSICHICQAGPVSGRAMSGRAMSGGARFSEGHSLGILKQPEDVAVGVGDGGDQATATDVVRGFLYGGTRSGHLGQLRLDVRHVPVGHRRGHAAAARHQPDVLPRDIEADVVRRVVLRRYAEQGGVHRLGCPHIGHRMQDGLDSLGGRAGHG